MTTMHITHLMPIYSQEQITKHANNVTIWLIQIQFNLVWLKWIHNKQLYKMSIDTAVFRYVRRPILILTDGQSHNKIIISIVVVVWALATIRLETTCFVFILCTPIQSTAAGNFVYSLALSISLSLSLWQQHTQYAQAYKKPKEFHSIWRNPTRIQTRTPDSTQR